MKKILLIILFLITVKDIFAAPVINEVYPAPATGEQEWVELYNDENFPLYIYNYILTDLAGNKIKLATDTIDAFAFTVATSSSVLNNSGDTVFLKNDLNEIINVASFSGTFNSTESFARCPDGGNYWSTTTIISKNSSNLPACFVLTPTPTATPTSTPTPTIKPTPYPTPTSYDDIFLSEAMVNPASGEQEWVEIYNGNDFTVSLFNWYIDDIEGGGSSPKKFSLDIPSHGYKVFTFASSIFNNDEDSVRLLDFNKNLKDDFEYFMSSTGQTYGRTVGTEDFCLQSPSYEAVNNSCLTPLVLVQSQPSPSITKVVKTVKSIAPTVKIAKFKVKNEAKHINKAEVLGTADKHTFQNPTLDQLSFLSLSYSLLTMLSILFKMKFKYAKLEKILFSLFYSPRGE